MFFSTKAPLGNLHAKEFSVLSPKTTARQNRKSLERRLRFQAVRMKLRPYFLRSLRFPQPRHRAESFKLKLNRATQVLAGRVHETRCKDRAPARPQSMGAFEGWAGKENLPFGDVSLCRGERKRRGRGGLAKSRTVLACGNCWSD